MSESTPTTAPDASCRPAEWTPEQIWAVTLIECAIESAGVELSEPLRRLIEEGPGPALAVEAVKRRYGYVTRYPRQFVSLRMSRSRFPCGI